MSKSGDLSTKEKIIKYATELFMENGTDNVSLREIADGVGISAPALYRHFKSLEELIYEACRYWVIESKKFNRDEERGLSSAKKQLDDFVGRHIEYTYKHRAHFSLLFSVYYKSMSSPQMLSLYQEIKSAACAKLLYILQLGNIDGSWKIKNPQDLAESIHSLVVAEVIKSLIDPKEFRKDERQQRVLDFVHLLFKTSYSPKT